MTHSERLLVSSATDASMVILPFSVVSGGRELKLFLNVQKIARVVELETLSPLSSDLNPFVGLYDMGGVPIPVLDLRSYFDRHPAPVPEARNLRTSNDMLSSGRRLILCNTMDFCVGLIVDRTRKVEAVPNAVIKAPSGLLGQGVFCAFIGDKERGAFRYLLDIESLLEKEGLNIVKHTSYETDSKTFLKDCRILFVDDSRFFQTLGRKLLEKFSATVDVASDGAEGLAKYQANPDAYDMVLTDIEMPIMSGIEMARAIRKTETRSIPIVFHSSISNIALIEDLRTQGLGDYITKFDEKSVIDAVRRHTARVN